MKRMMVLWSVCCVAVLGLFSCHPDYPVGGGGSQSGRQSGDTLQVSVAYGREVTIKQESLIIGFTDLLEESRCPRGVECVWEGNAKIRITLQTPPLEKITIAELNTHPDYPTSVEYEGREITLMELHPYPVYKVQVNPHQYVATLRIVKK